MSEVMFFVLLFVCFLFCVICTIVGPYIASYLAWVKYSQNCKDIFDQQNSLNNLSLITKDCQYKCLSVFMIFNIFNIIVLIIFLWLWISGKNNIYFIIPFIFIFILSYFLLYFAIKKLFKKFKLIGVDSREVAINKFKSYQNKFNNDKLKINNFTLYKSNEIALKNRAFQFNQWRYKGKISRLNNKNYHEDKYNIKLLHIYLRYLKTYAIFFKEIENDAKKFNNHYDVIINNQKYNSLAPLKTILISNFFAYQRTKNKKAK